MKRLLFAMALIAVLAAPALADKPIVNSTDTSIRVECGLESVCWTWDGSFTAETCDGGGAPVWQYGTATGIPTVDCDGNAIGNVLGTILAGNYPNDAGERAVLGGSFTVSETCNLLEICHYYDTENSYDGCNVEIYAGGSYTVVAPAGGYPDDLISDSTTYYAWCVDNQPGFTDGPVGFVKDCFDLSAFMGQTVSVAVKFGSDSSVQYPGWYIASAMAGSTLVPTEDSSWSTIKTLY
ncbi:MAG: hypothetical protein R3C71_15645 [Candidatus Krumholzibacteriia bacterium]|nr:immune inhibitor A [bacterium]MCB9516535.1 immune inhibitor A [Candidatus Latescibacterota bacterium]